MKDEPKHKKRVIWGKDAVRYCRKCQEFKPPRAHHCSECKACILKMVRKVKCFMHLFIFFLKKKIKIQLLIIIF